MIRLAPNPTFEADVDFSVAGDESPALAKFEFRALNRKRLLSLLVLTRITEKNWFHRAWEYGRLCWRVKRLATVVDMLDEIIVKWEGISEPYSRANLKTLLTEYPGSHIRIYTAYLKGMSEARRKN